MSKFEILAQLQAGNVAAVIERLEAEEREYERYLEEQELRYMQAVEEAERLEVAALVTEVNEEELSW